ncbi:hypothetical protein PF002_g31693 [Phytophthora fragariae]|uniref:Secreted protein n=1 Tax=Phytophthora fragariae TaxID=53985 RepID=A0A6A3PXM6_9STRA|nr:hypothetical protein PF003_g4399 [Phytophthora fragariae]KAE9063865.1 hypothetical protein PF006_g30839 [Phytophthora fragariae]KAE9164073.1 hypothetical protein PF002_g31693 [Phytophthora fragariae]
MPVQFGSVLLITMGFCGRVVLCQGSCGASQIVRLRCASSCFARVLSRCGRARSSAFYVHIGAAFGCAVL